MKKKSNERTFEEVLAELDELMKADFKKFNENLKKLSIEKNMDSVFENTENSINLADESYFLNNVESESNGDYDYGSDKITTGETHC